MDMASFEHENFERRPGPRRATLPVYSVTADFPVDEAVIDSEAELIDRLIGGLVAELCSGDLG